MRKPYLPFNPPDAWFWVLRILLSVISVTGNGIVVYLIGTRRRLQNNVNWFVLSLAVADFCFAFVVTVAELVAYLLAEKPEENFPWGVKIIYDMLLETSVFNLCALTLDRYIAVSFPLKYDHLMTKRRRLSIHALAWITGLLSPLPSFIAFYYQAYYSFRILQICFLLFCEILPAICLLVAYLRMVYIVRAHKMIMEKQTAQVTFNYQTNEIVLCHKTNHRRKSSIHVIGAVVLVFDFCFSASFYKGFANYVLFEHVDSRWAVDVTRLLYNVNSASNFLVYACMKTDIKREIKRRLNNWIHGTANANSSTTQSSHGKYAENIPLAKRERKILLRKSAVYETGV